MQSQHLAAHTSALWTFLARATPKLLRESLSIKDIDLEHVCCRMGVRHYKTLMWHSLSLWPFRACVQEQICNCWIKFSFNNNHSNRQCLLRLVYMSTTISKKAGGRVKRCFYVHSTQKGWVDFFLSYLFWHQSGTVRTILSLEEFKFVLSAFHNIQPATVRTDVWNTYIPPKVQCQLQRAPETSFQGPSAGSRHSQKQSWPLFSSHLVI